MDFSLSDEQRMIIETATKVGEDFGLDYWREQDAKKEFPREMWQAICDMGLCGVALPESVGGAGMGMLEMALVVESLAAGGGGATVGQLFMVNPIFGGVSINMFGTDAQKRELLPGLMNGDVNFCMALTEPDAGSNSLEIKTFAKKTDSGWCLNGRKIWITGVGDAGKMLLIARTEKREDVARKTDGITLFMIDVERKGLSYQPIEKVGTNTLSSCNVFFDDVEVREDEVLGEAGKGWIQLLDVLNSERIVTTAALVGAGKLAMKIAVEYGNQRKVFGDKPISSYQGIQFPLAQRHAELECARLMNLNAAYNCDQGLGYGSESNRAKLIAAQAAGGAIERAMQTLGGMGYAKESHLERLWRDARLFKFAPVSEEMILNYIAMKDLGMARSY